MEDGGCSMVDGKCKMYYVRCKDADWKIGVWG